VVTNDRPAKRMRLARTVIKFNTASCGARIQDYNLLIAKQSAVVGRVAHESINTAQALNMNTRSARTPDFEAIAVSYSELPFQSVC
jgi:hypothetical protein